MSENRELTMDDYLAMLRRRLKVILIPTLIAPIAGFMVSYAFSPKYTSQSTVLVEGQKVPDNYVMPVITADFTQRVQTLSQEVKGTSILRPVLHSLGLVKLEDEDKLIEDVRNNMQVDPVITSMSAAAAGAGIAGAKKKKPSVTDEPVPGFTVNYSDSNAVRAQRICNALTDLILTENLKERGDIAQSTTDFLGRQLEDAKRTVDDQDAKLAAFKKQYMGQLPTDVDNNMRMLMSLNSQLDASTQTLSRAQQDKAYTESMLAQQSAAWKTSQSSTNPQTLEQGLTQLQGQLLQLQARYTDDHPDVIKTKADIAEIEKATLDQKRLQSAIGVYQSRTAMSPGIEEQYKLLTRDIDNAQAFYKELLAKKSSSGLASKMESDQQGEQMHIVAAAVLPDAPSFPNRPLLAAGGLGVGLALGALIAIILEFSDKSIRTEKDAAAVMDLPLLISVPWLGDDEDDAANGNARRRFWGRRDPAPPKDHEHVEV